MYKYLLPLFFIFATFTLGLRSDPRMYEKAQRNIAMLMDEDGGSGTGWALQWRGKVYTVSNAHVCNIALKRGRRHMIAMRGKVRDRVKIIAFDEQKDLCVLTEMRNAEGYYLAQDWQVMQEVVVFGHPLGNALTPTEGNLLNREEVYLESGRTWKDCVGPGLSVKDMPGPFGMMKMCIRTVNAVYTTLKIFPGNSGSPVLDMGGQVVGVMFAGQTRSSYGFAIPLEDLKAMLSKELGQTYRQSN